MDSDMEMRHMAVAIALDLAEWQLERFCGAWLAHRVAAGKGSEQDDRQVDELIYKLSSVAAEVERMKAAL